MENKELLESMKREIETLRELVKSKDDMIRELQSRPYVSAPITVPQVPQYPWYQAPWYPAPTIAPFNPNLPYIITCTANDTSHVSEKFGRSTAALFFEPKDVEL